MPELPEVETVARRLSSLVCGKTINNIAVHRPTSFAGEIAPLRGSEITQVSRRAKLIRFHLDNGMNLLSHLKMTGQFIYVDDKMRVGGGHPTADWVSELPTKHTRVVMNLSDNADLYFNDMRVFGWIRALTDEQIAAEFLKYGPDVIDPAVTPEYFYEKLSRTARPIKIALMENKIVAGVGNIYASDALNMAQINPARPAKDLSLEEAGRLLKSAQAVINLGIKTGGATIDNYKNVDGFAGQYQDHVLAYGREGEACKQCGGKIAKSKIGGRGTFYCEVCQL